MLLLGACGSASEEEREAFVARCTQGGRATPELCRCLADRLADAGVGDLVGVLEEADRGEEPAELGDAAQECIGRVQ